MRDKSTFRLPIRTARTINGEHCLTPRAAARLLGKHYGTIIRMCDAGEVEHVIGGGDQRRRIYIPAREARRLWRVVHRRGQLPYELRPDCWEPLPYNEPSPFDGRRDSAE